VEETQITRRPATNSLDEEDEEEDLVAALYEDNSFDTVVVSSFLKDMEQGPLDMTLTPSLKNLFEEDEADVDQPLGDALDAPSDQLAGVPYMGVPLDQPAALAAWQQEVAASQYSFPPQSQEFDQMTSVAPEEYEEEIEMKTAGGEDAPSLGRKVGQVVLQHEEIEAWDGPATPSRTASPMRPRSATCEWIELPDATDGPGLPLEVLEGIGEAFPLDTTKPEDASDVLELADELEEELESALVQLGSEAVEAEKVLEECAPESRVRGLSVSLEDPQLRDAMQALDNEAEEALKLLDNNLL